MTNEEVISKPRAFTSGARDLARAIVELALGNTPREIPYGFA